jgi:nitroreductase
MFSFDRIKPVRAFWQLLQIAIKAEEQGEEMGGVVFFKTTIFGALREFYISKLGCEVWLEQPGICIVKHGNQLIGICKSNKADADMLLTFFYETRDEVDRKAIELGYSEGAKYNPDYNIYHFYTNDPEGRRIEIQAFEDKINPYKSGSEILKQRRSYREFTDQEVGQETLSRIFDECRYSPTSRNSESYYYVVITNQEYLAKIAKIRDGATVPIGRAKMAIAVCSDPEKTKRVQADADIAATYLLLAIENNNLGGCWITDLDRTEIKEMLEIPPNHYICMITPIGYTTEIKPVPERRESIDFVKYVK